MYVFIANKIVVKAIYCVPSSGKTEASGAWKEKLFQLKNQLRTTQTFNILG